MRRTYINEQYTDQELQNHLAGKCWCGADKSKFQKGMRAYCSPEHRNIWWSKTTTWQDFRDAYLSKHGRKCEICDATTPSHKDINKARNKIIDSYIRRQEVIDNIRAYKITKLEERYENDFKGILDEDIDSNEVEGYLTRHNIAYPEYRYQSEDIQFEVDHKVAIINGGKEFDESNLQVLCHDCHVKKTKNDLSLPEAAVSGLI